MRLLLIICCFLGAFTQLQAQQPTTLQEIKTDSVAKTLLQYFAKRQADSAYTLAGEAFKKPCLTIHGWPCAKSNCMA